MSLLAIVVASAVILTVAYFTYGRLLGRLLRLDDHTPTPAETLRDDLDYVPIPPKFLLGQHFSAIAAAGPIVGPILAGMLFGWAPALIWILVGSILIGGVHDLTSLVASIRHKARSIAEVVRDHMSQRSYMLFLAFVWLALVYIIVAFTDITASAFVGRQELENGEVVTGGGIATSSLLYLALPMIMGLLLRTTRLGLGLATVIFLPLVGLAIWIGQSIPLDLVSLLGVSEARAVKIWDVALLLYCVIASVTPMWLLLQPRGHLGGYFLYVALLGGMVGLLVSNQPIEYPAFRGLFPEGAGGKEQPLFPLLFITIACGACSGFHSLIASGTTSKQLRRESDARVIGYGAMLLEAMVAIVSLSCVMILVPGDSALASGKPNYIYAKGIGNFLQIFGVPHALGVTFALMAFTTFVYDTLDVCTRLGRYILQELTGWQGAGGRWFGTLVTAGAPLLFVTRTMTNAKGQAEPVWKTFWNLFGASNQLLAALTLLGVTVWLWQTRRAWWVWLVTGLPAALMYLMSTWALLLTIRGELVPAERADQGVSVPTSPVFWVAVMLVVLATLMLVEAARVIWGRSDRSGGSPPLGQGVAAS